MKPYNVALMIKHNIGGKYQMSFMLIFELSVRILHTEKYSTGPVKQAVNTTLSVTRLPKHVSLGVKSRY
jgi:hypothetical protein